MSKRPNQNYRYSVCFKQKVVEEVKAGLSITEIMRRYGIGGAITVKRWVQRYGDPSMLNEVIYVKMRKETDQIKALEQENCRLKIALADKTLAYDALETLLEVAGIDQSALKKTPDCHDRAVSPAGPTHFNFVGFSTNNHYPIRHPVVFF